jgi:lysophospholipase L1-like esterase
VLDSFGGPAILSRLTPVFMRILWCLAATVWLSVQAQELETRPADPAFARFQPLKAPEPTGLLLKPGDRLAIVGDSITEQRQYSRLMETYLTACRPDLRVTVRQYGWSGETAEGFKKRMAQDCLRFQPTIATTCYGMNDHRYMPFDAANGQWYRDNQQAIVRAFKEAGARVVLGSPGCVGPKVPWSKASAEDMNLNLCELRNLDLKLAQEEQVAFADVFWPMLTLGWQASQQYGTNFLLAGKDSVHPGWSGQVVMASAFLQALGLDGDLGTFTVDLRGNSARADGQHEVISFQDGRLTLRSRQYPYCAPAGELSDDNSIRAGLALTKFNDRFNRLRLVVENAPAERYRLTWGKESKEFTAAQLRAGINLAAEFSVTPFDAAFTQVDEAVGRKQAYETRQIKTLFHGEEGKADIEATVALTERTRAPLAQEIQDRFQPVTHTLELTPL